MEVVAERARGPRPESAADGGEDVSWASEVIRFRETGTEYRLDLDHSMPGEAASARIAEGGRESGVKLTRPQGPAFRELPRGGPLLRQAVEWLHNSRGVQRIAVYNGEVDFCRRLPVADLAEPGSVLSRGIF